MDIDIRRRLSAVEDGFLSAAAEGETSLQRFENNWLSLQTDIDLAIRNHQLSEETAAMAHDIASSISLLADSFLNMQADYDAMTLSLQSELDDLFSRVSLSSHTSHSGERIAAGSSAPTKQSVVASNAGASNLSNTPPYIAPAYRWLLKHIHNPYPSKATKYSFAEETGSSLSNIDAWFVHVRRRIGWTKLVRKWYKGSRSDAIDAAYRALVEDDPIRPLDANLKMEFIQVEANARELYAHKLVKSSLAGQMNRAVHDMTDIDRRRREELRALEAEEKRERIHKQKEIAKMHRAEEKAMQRMKRARAKSSYPSPDRSLSAPLASDVTDESDGELEEHRPIRSTRKQKRRSSPDSDDELDTRRCNKRPRIDIEKPDKNVIPELIIGLPSPAPEASVEISATSPVQRIEASSTPSLTPPAPSISRKRRLSEGSAQGAPKRPRGLPVGPRLQAVSDPLPKSNAVDFQTALEFDGWLKQINFDIPSPVSFEQLDPLAPLEIELFDYSSFADSNNDSPIQDHRESVTILKSLPSPKVTTSNPLGEQPPSRPINASSAESVDLLTGSELLEGPLDVELFQNWLSSPDFEQPAPNFAEFIDYSWDPNDFCDLGSAGSSDPTTFSAAALQPLEADCATSESALAWFHHLSSSTHLDPCNTNLTKSLTTPEVSAPNDVTDETFKREQEKVAKQKQLYELQEAARRLEAELSQA